VVDDELTSLLEEVRQRLLSTRSLEEVALLDLLPRKLAALPAQLIAESCEFLLLRQKSRTRGEPLLVGNDRMTYDAALIFHVSRNILPIG
jgi:hypothetical protein